MCRRLLLFLSLLGTSAGQSRPAADLIIINANVYTMDSKKPKAEAVAVLGDRIAAVGSNSEIEAWRGPKTRVIDAGGKLVLPGFNDAHVHFVNSGLALDSVQLKAAASPAEFVRIMAEFVRSRPKGEWVTGGNWDEQNWNPPKLPTKDLVDPVTPDTPVAVSRYDGHMCLANSVALRLAGITAKTPDPPGGTIVRDAHGNPTGILKDAAQGFIDRVIPPPSRSQRIAAARRALAHARSVGVTSVQEMGNEGEDLGLNISIYKELEESGELTTRIYVAPMIEGWDKQGLQLCIHAIGDEAISLTLDLFQNVIQANGQRDRRLRIEHAQHLASKDFDRFAKLGVIASVQPYHAIDDGRWAERRIGPQRIKTTYAFRSFLDHG